MALKPIVAGTDGSAESLRAVEWAVREAALRKTALRSVAVPALPPRMSRHQPEGRPDTVADVAHKTYLRALGSAADCAAELEPGVVLDTALLSGPPAQALAETAAYASMLVVGSRGAGTFAALVLGSVSRYAATHARCPVVVAREESLAVHREIVVGVGDLDQPDAQLQFFLRRGGSAQGATAGGACVVLDHSRYRTARGTDGCGASRDRLQPDGGGHGRATRGTARHLAGGIS